MRLEDGFLTCDNVGMCVCQTPFIRMPYLMPAIWTYALGIDRLV